MADLEKSLQRIYILAKIFISAEALPVVDVPSPNYDNYRRNIMFDTRSDFSLNKADADAIVCPSVTGVHIRLTREDFSSEEEFQRWKMWSDENYYQIDRDDVNLSKRSLPLHDLAEKAAAVQSPEDALIELLDNQERQALRHLLMEGLDRCLTPTQRRRLWMYCVENLTLRQIAAVENVHNRSVFDSLAAAKRRLKNFLKKI